MQMVFGLSESKESVKDEIIVSRRPVLLMIWIFGVLFSTLLPANEVPDHIKGALCVVRADDKIVLVNEILTKQISLPGGIIDQGEPPHLTAERETWEESGLVVTAKEILGYTATAVIYDCVSDSDVIAYDFNNVLDGHELPVWFAPHYGVEVASAMLLSPDNLESHEYRYPAQWPAIRAMFNDASNQPVTYVDNLIKAAPSFNQVELGWMSNLQQAISSLPSAITAGINSLSMLAMTLTKPWLMLVLFPLAYWYFGKEFGYKLFFTVTVTSLLCLVAQQGFSLPKPHVYTPALELLPSYGFSFPSLPIAVWSCAATLVFYKLGKLSFNKATLGFLAFITWIAFSKFYSGSAFITDMVVGALFGSLSAWNIIRLSSRQDIDLLTLVTSKGVWFGLTGATVVITAVWPLPVFTAWLAVLLTASMLVISFDRNKEMIDFKQVIATIVLLLLVNEVILYGATFVSYSGILSLGVETIRFPLLILLFVVSVRKGKLI